MQFDGLVFFLLSICIGYFFARWKLIPASAANALPPILLNIFFPAMLITSFSDTDAQSLLSVGLPTVICTLIFSILSSGLILLPLRKAGLQKRRLLRFISGVGNTSFICIPLMQFFLSDSQMIIVFIHGAVCDFLIWGIHHQLFRQDGKHSLGQALKKLLTSPCLIAVVVGILCCLLQVRIPSFLRYTLDALATACSPLSLIFIGILIQSYGLFSWRKEPIAIFFSLWRVILLPCFVFLSLYWILPLDTVLILTLLFGSPAPISAVLWCKQYGGDTELAVNCLIPSTLLYLLLAGSSLFLLSHLGLLG